ncbi:MAG: hypothetical protein AB7T49_12935 [Oligoflexales bacterium]
MKKVFCLVIVLLSGCQAAKDGKSHSSMFDDQHEPKVVVVVSVDWEGRDLSDANLAKMEQFRRDFPDVGLLHFLNAAYYYKPGANPSQINAKIRRTLTPDDELGLHIHSWKRLIEAAQVTHRTTPTWWESTDAPLSNCAQDCGHEVPLSAYDVNEIRKIVRFSNKTLAKQGFGRPRTFRTGGWMAYPNVIEALVLEGFTIDSSAVPAQFLKPKLGSYYLYKWADELWDETAPTSQPYRLGESGRQLNELPDNGCLADYMTSDQMLEVFKKNADAFKAGKGREDVFVTIGFHQETADSYLQNVVDAIHKIEAYSQQNHIPLEFARFPLGLNYRGL